MAESTFSELKPDTEYDTSYGVEREYRMALLGRTGSGKSATGNHILGKKAFESKLSGSSVTNSCSFNTAERFGKKLVVVDTPGLFDTKKSNDDITKEIVKCIGILTPGPHVFILVVEPKRFTPEEQDTIRIFSETFGDEFFKYLLVLFTRRDELENNDMTIDDYVEQAPEQLQTVLKRCDQKYVAFDNSKRNMEDKSDVIELIRLMEEIRQRTGKSHYSNEMFEKAEQEFQQRADEIRLEEKVKAEQTKKSLDEELRTELTKLEDAKKEIEVQRKDVEAVRNAIKAREVNRKEKSEELAKARESQELEKMEIETLKEKVKARDIEIQEMHKECQAKDEELKKDNRKQQEYEKEMQEKEKRVKKIEDRLIKLQKQHTQKKKEAEMQYQEKIKDMRDNDRKEFENGNLVGRLMATLWFPFKFVWKSIVG